jgi:streptogramin lyase
MMPRTACSRLIAKSLHVTPAPRPAKANACVAHRFRGDAATSNRGNSWREDACSDARLQRLLGVPIQRPMRAR